MTPPLMTRATETLSGEKRSKTFMVFVSAINETQNPVKVSSDNPAVVQEFSEVFADMPLGLPPDRDLGHTISVVELSPVFKRMYSLSPKEKQQVKGLLARGLIRPIQHTPVQSNEVSGAAHVLQLPDDDLLDRMQGASMYRVCSLAITKYASQVRMCQRRHLVLL